MLLKPVNVAGPEAVATRAVGAKADARLAHPLPVATVDGNPLRPRLTTVAAAIRHIRRPMAVGTRLVAVFIRPAGIRVMAARRHSRDTRFRDIRIRDKAIQRLRKSLSN